LQRTSLLVLSVTLLLSFFSDTLLLQRTSLLILSVTLLLRLMLFSVTLLLRLMLFSITRLLRLMLAFFSVTLLLQRTSLLVLSVTLLLRLMLFSITLLQQSLLTFFSVTLLVQSMSLLVLSVTLLLQRRQSLLRCAETIAGARRRLLLAPLRMPAMLSPRRMLHTTDHGNRYADYQDDHDGCSDKHDRSPPSRPLLMGRRNRNHK
jgi:hypothetical protein